MDLAYHKTSRTTFIMTKLFLNKSSFGTNFELSSLFKEGKLQKDCSISKLKILCRTGTRTLSTEPLVFKASILPLSIAMHIPW